MDLLKLPPEVVLKILFYVNGNDIEKSQRVCKDWNDFIHKWILKNPSSRHPYKINQNWMTMNPGYKQTELRCKEREKWTYNLLAAGNKIFVMNLDKPHFCGIFTGDKIHEHRVAHKNGGSYALISDKLIIITYDGDGTDENDLWPERRDILERLENGEVCVRATNQRFVAHEMKCDREFFVIQENDEKAEEDVKMPSLYKLEKEKIRKVSTENLAVNFKLLKFRYPYIVLKKMRNPYNREYQLTVMKIDAQDNLVHHKSVQYHLDSSVDYGYISDATFVKDHFFLLEHGRMFKKGTEEWLRVINADTGADVSDQLVPTDDPIVLSVSRDTFKHSDRVCMPVSIKLDLMIFFKALWTNGEQLILPSCRRVLVYDIDGLIKGCSKKDISAMHQGTSKKRRILKFSDPEKGDGVDFWTDTVMTKDSITRYTEYKNPLAKIKIKTLDFYNLKL